MSTLFKEIKDELLVKEDVNVILIEDRYEVGINIIDAKRRQSDLAQIIINVLQNIQVSKYIIISADVIMVLQINFIHNNNVI